MVLFHANLSFYQHCTDLFCCSLYALSTHCLRIDKKSFVLFELLAYKIQCGSQPLEFGEKYNLLNGSEPRNKNMKK